MNINPATSRRLTQLPPETFGLRAGICRQLPIPRLGRITVILCALLLAWNAQGLCLSGPAPTYFDRPDYNYAGVTCPTCHFTDAVNHTSRAAGVSFGSAACVSSGFPSPCCTGPGTGTCTANQWNRTGHGWWDSRHSQSLNGWSSTAINYGWPQGGTAPFGVPGPYGENANTFCANCHSPLQASIYSVASVSESGTTATITPAAPGIPLTDISVGDTIFLTGTASLAVPPVACAGYNNTATALPPPAIGGWTVSNIVPDATNFYAAQIQFTAATSGLATCYGGTLGDATTTSPFYSGEVLNPVPVLSTAGNSACTASGVPWACCTGAGTGSCTGTIAASAAGFPGVWCSACHPSTSVASTILARYPGALSNGETATLVRGANPALASSWVGIVPGFAADGISNESHFCLTCHEQDPHNAASNQVYAAMYSSGVSCIDCHMAPFTVNTGSTTNSAGTPAGLVERFHDWKVAENLPYSCGAQGSLAGYTCHPNFTAASALAFIPFLTGQHSDWWSLPPFSTDMAAISAHEMNATSDQLALWREIQQVYGGGSVKETVYKEGPRPKSPVAAR